MDTTKITTKEAFDVIKQAMVEDGEEPGSYAHSWHCNIAMMCYDAILNDKTIENEGTAHRIANDAASRCMKLFFNVETK